MTVIFVPPGNSHREHKSWSQLAISFFGRLEVVPVIEQNVSTLLNLSELTQLTKTIIQV